MFLLQLLLRLIEGPIFGQRRPVTPWITVAYCRLALRVLGFRVRREGHVMRHPGAIVANHTSWLDIFSLNASGPLYFVSKAEVRGWVGIGWLARGTGTLFVRRDRREARGQVETFRQRLTAGHRLLFFPEGTSTDGQQVLAFKPTLFAAFFDDALRERTWIQPVTVVYRAPDDADPRLYGWWGNMDFGPHLLGTLTAHPQGEITVIHHDPVRVAEAGDRKTLARACEEVVRRGLLSRLR
ncbi:1-acyl-sn-glycerol-3-phosphate acyltransferase [Pelagovum pacificum]|uniref:1-acyl-sn-glycerol-3-phosphate acyltransferase n=2 Tax=Pelagovum pacificum TaxID=2588711 RepID=A0A5C5GHQ3_9RHOB|nr:1-acyl-sn-glycerol-3-phosphate acyltransferase [Pelagovum pacificum]TNY34292.1 1-acyl-sn-glycerol-3-phosphate acyltransferase [Pelagovum pacificum]